MGKDFKEKYERVCSVKDKAISLVETQLNGNIENVDAKELGEVADIAKDFAEIMKLCCEAEYYYKVTEAMDEGSDEEKKYYLNKYIPEYEGKFYTPMYARQRDSRGRYMYTEPTMTHDGDSYRDRMYYSSMNGNAGSSRSNMNMGMNDMGRDSREGRSGMTRRTYMEMKENGEASDVKMKELEKYMTDLSSDITDMISHMSSDEKSMVKSRIKGLADKIQ